MTSLEEQFDEAVNSVSSGGVNLSSQEDQLKLYGYYTRVKKGVCEGPRPGPWELRKQAKYDAWKDASETAREDAMQEYIEIVGRLAAGSGGVKTNVQDKRPLGFAVDDEHKSGTGEVPPDICLYASQGDMKSLVHCVKAQKVSSNYVDAHGMTPLICAADRDHKDIVLYLLRNGALPNDSDMEGQTALHYAVLCDHVETAVLLVKYGAHMHYPDSEGETPFQLASDDTKQHLLNAEKSAERYNLLVNRVAVPTLFIATGAVLTAALIYQWKTWKRR
ncbi:hypothetical protein NDN08_003592 [Rhodosorus marinus]|uniref:ACB domain-containing protein n=1 Tax=Rhodosorus marinus TaxID=101924 RepID=A0AAV8UWX1_9RHOD|nr:hypothetical protein NDN08_003592 [Rhodosorus marinus]